jgi:hypothetical protein
VDKPGQLEEAEAEAVVEVGAVVQPPQSLAQLLVDAVVVVVVVVVAEVAGVEARIR